MKKFFFLSLIVILILGCSSYKPPKTYNFQNWADYALPFDEVWSRVIRFFAESGVNIKTMDKASGFIVTENISFNGALGQFLDCGEPGKAVFAYAKIENPIGYFNVYITKISEQATRVQIKTFYKAIYSVYQYDDYRKTFYKASESWMNCNSTGFLETGLLKYLAQ